jgi:uncharacterized integral membrane protein
MNSPEEPRTTAGQEFLPSASSVTKPENLDASNPVDPSVSGVDEGVGGEPGPSMGRTRLSGTWTGLAVALVVLVLLLIFLMLNLGKVEMNFYGAHVRAPLAVALLFAVVLGALLVFGVGAARILQVRVRAKRSRDR